MSGIAADRGRYAARPDMAKQFIPWFVYCLVISVFAAYAAGRTFPGGAEYLAVFRIAGVFGWFWPA